MKISNCRSYGAVVLVEGQDMAEVYTYLTWSKTLSFELEIVHFFQNSRLKRLR